MLPLRDKELKVLEIVRKLGEVSAKDVWKNLNEDIPYTTVSSILKKLNRLGIVEKRAVKSRGRRGVKYLYSMNKDIAKKLFETYEKITGKDGAQDFAKVLEKNIIGSSGDSIVLIDNSGRIVFAYADKKILDEVFGERLNNLYPMEVLAKLRRNGRDEFRSVVEANGERFEKIYRAVRSFDGTFLGIVVITRKISEKENSG